jgi:hypothetical protein
MPSAEQLAALKELIMPVLGTISALVTALLAFYQSKCRRDLDIAYGEIRFLKTGKRTVRKPGQILRKKKDREMVEAPEGIKDHDQSA